MDNADSTVSRASKIPLCTTWPGSMCDLSFCNIPALLREFLFHASFCCRCGPHSKNICKSATARRRMELNFRYIFTKYHELSFTQLDFFAAAANSCLICSPSVKGFATFCNFCHLLRSQLPVVLSASILANVKHRSALLSFPVASIHCRGHRHTNRVTGSATDAAVTPGDVLNATAASPPLLERPEHAGAHLCNSGPTARRQRSASPRLAHEIRHHVHPIMMQIRRPGKMPVRPQATSIPANSDKQRYLTVPTCEFLI